MQDGQIVELYFARNEEAISATSAKYNSYCMQIAMNILHNREDSEECVNDTYLAAWNSIPPQRPEKLSAYLGKLTRNLSLNRYKSMNAARRGGGELALSLHELDECIADNSFIERGEEEIGKLIRRDASLRAFKICDAVSREHQKLIVESSALCLGDVNQLFEHVCRNLDIDLR